MGDAFSRIAASPIDGLSGAQEWFVRDANVLSMAVNRSGLAKRAALWALALVLVVLLAAWIHGGEEQVHTITQPIEVEGFEAVRQGQ